MWRGWRERGQLIIVQIKEQESQQYSVSHFWFLGTWKPYFDVQKSESIKNKGGKNGKELLFLEHAQWIFMIPNLTYQRLLFSFPTLFFGRRH